MTKFYQVNKFQLAKDYNNGMTLALIAKKHGISIMSVNRYIRLLGIYKPRIKSREYVTTCVTITRDVFEYLKKEEEIGNMSKFVDTALRFYISHLKDHPREDKNPFSIEWLKSPDPTM